MAAVDSEKMVFCTFMYHSVGVLDIILTLSINRYSYHDNYDKNIILVQSAVYASSSPHLLHLQLQSGEQIRLALPHLQLEHFPVQEHFMS